MKPGRPHPFRPFSPWALLLVLALPQLAGARRNTPPAAAVPAKNQPTTSTNTQSISSEPKPALPPVTHTVLEGQTLWDIARAYDVTVQEIMQANNMRPGKVRHLKKGSQIIIPNASQSVMVETAADRSSKKDTLPPLTDGAYHFLRRGETLSTLADLYDVSLDELMQRNGFSDDDLTNLKINQPIIIPGIKSGKIKNAEPTRSAGIVHEVIKGESIWDVAHTFQVSVAALMAANGLSAQDVASLREGAKLLVPGVEEDAGGNIKHFSSARQRRAMTFARQLRLGSALAAHRLLHGEVEPRWIRAAGGSKRLEGTLRWPVTSGWYTRGYGSGEGGYHLATDIMGKIGWNVRAAAAGIVGYSGNQVSGFGNMVILVHPGGWITLYAHNSVNFVTAGEKVARGAVLAELGATGNATGPHVHFELIYKGNNCDPALLFRPGVQHKNGRISRLKYLSWISSRPRPEQIRCAPRRRHPRGKAVAEETPGDENAEPQILDTLPPSDASQSSQPPAADPTPQRTQ